MGDVNPEISCADASTCSATCENVVSEVVSFSDPSVLTPLRGSYASAAQKNVPNFDSGDVLLIDLENELPGCPLTIVFQPRYYVPATDVFEALT